MIYNDDDDQFKHQFITAMIMDLNAIILVLISKYIDDNGNNS